MFSFSFVDLKKKTEKNHEFIFQELSFFDIIINDRRLL